MVLQQEGQTALDQNRYIEAVQCFEQLAEEQPDKLSHQLYLGFAYLLEGQEDAAQLTWAIALSKVSQESMAEDFLMQLSILFKKKLNQLEQQEDLHMVWLLCRHLHELLPSDSYVILKGIYAAIGADLLTIEQLDQWGLLEALEYEYSQDKAIDRVYLQSVLEKVINWDNFGHISVLSWVKQFIKFIPDRSYMAEILLGQAMRMSQQAGRQGGFQDARTYLEVALEMDANNFLVKIGFPSLYFLGKNFRRVAALSQELLPTCKDIQEQLIIRGYLISAYMHIPEYWQEGKKQLQISLDLLPQLIQEYRENSFSYVSAELILSQLFYLQYIEDSPLLCRTLQNQLSAAYCECYQQAHVNEAEQEQATQELTSFLPRAVHSKSRSHDKIRLGFISAFMKRHSIGWLSRWFFQYYDRSRFEVYTYFRTSQGTSIGISEFSHQWFAQTATKATETFGSPKQVANLIAQDEIDILIDLDSLTATGTFNVLALKPAPIQVTWLGYDASGLPTIDYFLADPYVLPKEADSYYAEQIWRLPRTYIAVDGFEMGVPTLRRDTLGIPANAVVYWSAQSAVKRHPDITRCQIQILKQVPNSYLLMKGLGDEASLQTVIRQVAEAEGIDSERLRFLPSDPDEATHRANMAIADVVLDTFPYTGATTTMETLWVGVPLVTRVGKQFSSRNSYAMLHNAGIDTGIAHSAEEYIEWGVRYGNDAELRQQVRQKLREARQTAPLWNARQFTRDIEVAFEAMWQRYLEQ